MASKIENAVHDFIVKVKDDPFASELFRVAANELHQAIASEKEKETEPQPAEQPQPPVQEPPADVAPLQG